MSVLLITIGVLIGILLVLVGIALIGLAIFMLLALIQADKLIYGLPWLKWLTLSDAVAMGHSEFWCKMLLPVLHRNGCLEVRPHKIDIDKLPEGIREAAIKCDLGALLETFDLEFEYKTVALHEFRLTKRGRRRFKLKPDLKDIFRPTGWQPKTA